MFDRVLTPVCTVAMVGVAAASTAGCLDSAPGGDPSVDAMQDAPDTAEPTRSTDTGSDDREPDARADVADTERAERDDTGIDADGEEPTGYPDPLAVDRSNPWIYVNDIPTDNFNGELALAMGSDDNGGVDLRGFIMEFPKPAWWDEEKFQRVKSGYVSHHETTYQKAVDSGFTGLPPVEFGPFRRHEKPSSGNIEDTEPIGSAGTRRILEEAREATVENPLVVSCGGPLATVADAYLRDPSIAHKVVVYWRETPDEENQGWNSLLSGWSATIVAREMQLVLAPGAGGPVIERSELRNKLPDEPLRDYMLNKVYDGTGKNPLGDDGKKGEADAVSSMSPMYPQSRGEVQHVAVDGFEEHWKIKEEIPDLVTTSEETNIVLIEQHSGLDSPWWGHMADPTTWDGM